MNTEEDFKKVGEVLKNHEGVVEGVPLVMSRVPPDVKARFVNWANEEFCSDFGMAFKFLIDMYMPQSIAMWAKIEEIETRLSNLERIPEKKPEVEFLDGSKRKVGGGKGGNR